MNFSEKTVFAEQTLARLACDYAFYYEERGETPYRASNCSGNHRFKTASIIKVPILFAWIELERTGEADRTQLGNLDHEPPVRGAGFSYLLDNRLIPYHDMLLHMMATSDNLCTNAVIERIGMERLNQVWRERFGLTETHLGRKMMETPDPASGRDNWVTGADLEKWFGVMDRLNAEENALIQKLMGCCQDSNILFRDFEDDYDGFYHKTGGLPGVMNDWGFSDGKRFFLVTNNVEAKTETRRLAGKLGRIILYL